jgi:signal transduction histidine kinase
MSSLTKLTNKIAGQYPVFSIQERAARITCFYTGFNFAIGALMVLAYGLSGSFLAFQVLASVMYFAMYYLLTRKQFVQTVIFLVVVTLCIMFGLYWFYAGGLKGPALVSSVVVFYSCFNVIEAKHKPAVSTFIFFVIGITFLLSFLHPEWVSAYPQGNRAYLHYFILVLQFSGYFIFIEASNQYCFQYEQNQVSRKNLELERANEAKLRLFTIISHDLRGPMATLRAILNSVEEGFSTPEKTQRQLSHLKTMMTPMNSTLNNLLLWSRLQLEGLNTSPEWFNAGDILQDEIQMAAEEASLAGVTISNHIPDNTRLYADMNHCRIIFRNLISNAIRYAHRGTVVELSETQAGGNTVFMVTNSGRPIPPLAAEEFNRSGTLASTERTTKPSGLGLQLCSTFVKASGGAIWIDTSTPEKTVFCFSMGSYK